MPICFHTHNWVNWSNGYYKTKFCGGMLPIITIHNYINNIIITSSRWTHQPIKHIADIANAVIDIFYADIKRVIVVLLNLKIWQNSGADRGAASGKHVICLSSTIHVLVLHPICGGWKLTSDSLAIKVSALYEKALIFPHIIICIHKLEYNLMHFRDTTKAAELIKWKQCVCTQHVVFAWGTPAGCEPAIHNTEPTLP